MVAFHHTLSQRSVYSRYFTPLSLSERTSHQRLARLCFADYDREISLVAEHLSAGAPGEIVGVARLSKEHGVNEAEFALLISDAWQGRGLGRQLLEQLVQIAKAERLTRLTGVILADNRPMIDLARRLGFTLSQPPGSREYQAVLTL
jgi:acetyltransferase